ncbi:MAG: Fic family protein [bacterium]
MSKELYHITATISKPVDLAAVIFESIVTNHAFIDGNKRTVYVYVRLLLLDSRINMGAMPKYETAIIETLEQ